MNWHAADRCFPGHKARLRWSVERLCFLPGTAVTASGASSTTLHPLLVEAGFTDGPNMTEISGVFWLHPEGMNAMGSDGQARASFRTHLRHHHARLSPGGRLLIHGAAHDDSLRGRLGCFGQVPHLRDVEALLALAGFGRIRSESFTGPFDGFLHTILADRL